MISTSSEIVSLFIDTIIKTDATVEKIEASPEALCNSLMKSVRGCENIVISEPEFISRNLFANFQESVNVCNHPNANQLAFADAGITDAFAGVAQTGSICITITSGFSTYVSLLPRKHIVVLDSKNIVERPRDIFNLPISNKSVEQTGWIFISGPSATADMGELVKGVHGPDKLHIILLVDK
ncbi:MAG: LUD domain-containing protein [Ignavibacteriaceae bacterium]